VIHTVVPDVDGFRGNSNTGAAAGDGLVVAGWLMRVVRWGAVPAALVVVGGAAASTGAAVVLHRSERVAAGQVMDRRAAAMRDQVTVEAQRYVDAVRASAAALGAQETITSDRFLAVTEPMVGMGLHGATSIAFLASTTDVAAAQAYWRERGAPGLRLVPSGAGPEHVFGIFGRALDGAPAPDLGVDVTPFGPPAEALQEARRSGRVAVSSAYTMIRDRALPSPRRQMSFVLAAPVRGPQPAAAPRGWILMGLHGQDFIQGTLRQAARDLTDVRLVATAADGDQIDVAGLRGARGPADLHRQADVPVAQRRWLLRTDAVAATTLPGGRAHLDQAAAVAGTALTLLLAALVLALTLARRRAEARVSAVRGEEEARMAAVIAELNAFAGVVAHDLKSPLTAITGYAGIAAECLETQPPDLETVRFTVDRVVTSSARMRGLIDDLLTYATARDNALRVEQTDLRAVVDRVVTDRLDEPRPADVPVPEIYVGPLPTVEADPVLLDQLIQNLVGNAIKYTPPGQPARIDVTAEPDRPGWIRVEVADRGIGIPAGQHTAIFGSFHRAHPTAGFRGTGLGLAICQRIVERHGGIIHASDNPGGGARFRFTLPDGATVPQPRSGRLSPSRAPW
jgi:signal transduction histidine kinase